MEEQKIGRRKFFRSVAATGTLVVGCLAFGFQRVAEAEVADSLGPLDENDPIAKTLGYINDASKVDTVKWPKKQGPDGARQLCSTCNFYQGNLKKVDGKDYGKCIIFQNGLVAPGGWCNSWAPKVQ